MNGLDFEIFFEGVLAIFTPQPGFLIITINWSEYPNEILVEHDNNVRLKPPKGTFTSIMECELTQTVPASSLFAIVNAREISRENIAAARPNELLFASRTSSSSVLYFATATTKDLAKALGMNFVVME